MNLREERRSGTGGAGSDTATDNGRGGRFGFGRSLTSGAASDGSVRESVGLASLAATAAADNDASPATGAEAATTERVDGLKGEAADTAAVDGLDAEETATSALDIAGAALRRACKVWAGDGKGEDSGERDDCDAAGNVLPSAMVEIASSIVIWPSFTMSISVRRFSLDWEEATVSQTQTL